MNGFSVKNDIHDIDVITNNKYNISKLDYRVSQTLTGLNANITTNNTTFTLIGNQNEEIYTFDYTLTNNLLSVVSSSDQDTISGGTGIKIILIGGVDQNYDLIQEVIQLNGTTPVLSINNFQMVNTMSILSIGSNKRAVGNITIKASNNSNVHAIIPVNGSSIQTGRYTIQNGYTGYLDSLVASNSQGDNGEIGVFIVSKTFPIQQKGSLILYNTIFTTSHLSYTAVPSKYTIIYAYRRISTGNPASVTVSQRIKLIGNTEIV